LNDSVFVCVDEGESMKMDLRTKTREEKNQKRVVWSKTECKGSSKCIKSELDVENTKTKALHRAGCDEEQV